MNCEQMTDLLSAFLDGELTAIEQAQVQEHLEQCPECRALYEQLQTLHTSFSDLEEIPAPENFAQGVMSRIKAEEKPKVIPLFKRPQVRAVMGLAACAVLCIGFARVAMDGGYKGSNMAPAAAAPEAAMPESAAYDVSVEATNGQSGFGQARTESAPAEAAVEAPQAPAAPAPMEPGNAPAEYQLDGQGVGAAEKAELSMSMNCIFLQELPEGFEDAVGQLQWEERIEDGALCARLTAEQMETLLKLVDDQALPVEVTDPDAGESDQWLLVLTE